MRALRATSFWMALAVAPALVATPVAFSQEAAPTPQADPGPEPAAPDEAAEASAAECPRPEPPVTDRPGLERLLGELSERQRELDRREAELDERERSLTALESEATRRISELQSLQDAIEGRIAEIEAQGDESVKRLSKVYASMPPGRAAPLLESLEPELATEILRRMKHKKSAAVLSVMSESHALRLSRRVARPLASLAEESGSAP